MHTKIDNADEARQYLIKFMREHFSDKAFADYILTQLPGNFAWNLAAAIGMHASNPASPAPVAAITPTDEQIIEAVRAANVKCMHREAATTLDIASAVLKVAAPQAQAVPVAWIDTRCIGNIKWRDGLTRGDVTEGQPLYFGPPAAAAAPSVQEAKDAALELAAGICDEIHDDWRARYKGRAPHAPNNPHSADPHADSLSDGAAQCANRIRELKSSAAPRTAATETPAKPLTRCAAGCDGECAHPGCPQLRDNEPAATGRYCPLDVDKEGT